LYESTLAKFAPYLGVTLMGLVLEGGEANSQSQNAILWTPEATFLGDPL
jgi:hypothetical protein